MFALIRLIFLFLVVGLFYKTQSMTSILFNISLLGSNFVFLLKNTLIKTIAVSKMTLLRNNWKGHSGFEKSS